MVKGKENSAKENSRVEKGVEKEWVAKDKGKGKQLKQAPVWEYQPWIPKLAHLKKEQMDDQYKMFLGLFKRVHINLPFVEALAQMPNYAKYLKGLLTYKRKLKEVSMVILNEECSVILP